MHSKKKIDRRAFISTAATAAATISIVPSHVLAGSGKVAPSDKITVANIGCGTQGLREMSALLQHPNVQVVSVCDPNKFTTNYLDWSANGIRDSIRKTIGDPNWGAYLQGIPGGRDVGQDYVEKYYAKNKPSGKYKGCTSYEDYRELLEKESGVDVVKIMTPDHLHSSIAIAAMKKGKKVVTHKPIGNRMVEGLQTIETARTTGMKTHLLAWSPKPDHSLILKWINDGVIGNLKEIHNWSFRPVWPQFTGNPVNEMPIPKGFNWDLWLGPVPHRPYHKDYTHNVFRGWYDFGGGSIADMGHYSLFPLFKTFGIDRAPVSAKAYGTVMRTAIDGVCKEIKNKDTFPYSSMVRLKFPEQKALPSFDLFWYDGGMKPFAPEELEEDGRDIPSEGMMFVGDKGKIIASFLGENPEIIPLKKKEAYQGEKEVVKAEEKRTPTDIWVNSFVEGVEAPGSFLHAKTVTETINLAAIALRAGKKVDYDSEKMKITNDENANKFLTREFRKGWEL